MGVVLGTREELPTVVEQGLAFTIGIAAWGLVHSLAEGVDTSGAFGVTAFVLLMAVTTTGAWAWGVWSRGKSLPST
jgi:hypothetical protein